MGFTFDIPTRYPWNLLGQRLQVIDDQFKTVTNEYGEIKTAIDRLDREIGGLREDSRNLTKTVGGILEEKMSVFQLHWLVITVSTIVAIGGIVLTIVTNESALKFLKLQGSWIGILLSVIALVVLVLAVFRKQKK